LIRVLFFECDVFKIVTSRVWHHRVT